MKQVKWIWLRRILGAALLLSAGGIILWQGVGYGAQERTEVQQILSLDTQESTTSVTTGITTSTVTTDYATTQTKASTNATAISSASATQAASVSFPLNLNTASAAELEQLPGIGEVLSQRIVAYREQIGGYSYLEQLLEVQGIGDGIYAQIAGYLYLEETFYPESTSQRAEESAAIFETEAETESIAEPAVSFPLDLNLAEKDELLAIPDMTETLADEILAFREEIQYYSSVYELLYVEEMTDTYFQKIRDYVQVDDTNLP